MFIKDCFKGAFCLFESMHQILSLVDELIVMDLGSTDGTFESLLEIANNNPRVKLYKHSWPKIDAGVFADLANQLIDMCLYDNVLYYQADEIWHENLLRLTYLELLEGNFDLSFWRIQYRENFQEVKWFPHLVHRIGQKGKFNFVDDGMSTDRTFDAKVCSSYGGEWFPKWGSLGQEGIKPYVNEMIMDVSLLGGFRDNIIERRALHAPFWHEEPIIENMPADKWAERAVNNPAWERTESPYDLPAIMNYHIGKTRYTLRKDLLEALKYDKPFVY